MADVFISYAHTTASQARAAAAALRAAGYSVWLDDDLAVHREFTRAIEEQLEAAKAALVIWSADAARSAWVLSEANRAREAGKLVQLLIDGTRLPMPFDQVQCADLTGWTGEGEHPNWRRVVASIRSLVGVAPTPLPITAAVASPVNLDPLLAVLAFDNLSGDPDMTYFSDGVSEEILDTLSRGSDLRVIARSSSFQFRGADKAVRRVAADLKATHLLDGSVRRSGQRIRVSARLIDCASDTAVWSQRFDQELTDIFALQDEIALAVSSALEARFARRANPPPIDPTAYDLFLRAQTLGESVLEDQRRRMTMLEEVVARAPAFARAWAMLARDRAIALRMHAQGHAASGLTSALVREAAQHALRLDPEAGVAWQALALSEPWAAHGAQETLHWRALAVAPNDVVVLATYRIFCSGVGRLREAIDVARRARDLDPHSPSAASALGVQLGVAGQSEESSRVIDAALNIWPDNLTLVYNAIMFSARRGDAARVEAVASAWPNSSIGDLVSVCRRMARPTPSSNASMLDDLRRELARSGTLTIDARVNFLYSQGNHDQVFQLLDSASFEQVYRDGASPYGQLNPGWPFSPLDRLYQDRRFPRFCAKLGLTDYWVESGKWPDCADDVDYDFRAECRAALGERR